MRVLLILTKSRLPKEDMVHIVSKGNPLRKIVNLRDPGPVLKYNVGVRGIVVRIKLF